MPKTRKLIFSGLFLAVSAYFSVLFAIGLAAGYLATQIFQKKTNERTVYINFRKRKLHVHHWIYGSVALGVFWIVGILAFLPIVLIGAICGIIAHDLYTDKKWYKILERR